MFQQIKDELSFINLNSLEMSDPLSWGGPAFIILIIAELLFSLKYDKELYQWKDFASSSFMGVGAAGIALVTKGITILFFFAVYFLFNPMVDGVRVNFLGYEAFGFAWFLWIICQVADDFSYYCFHRANHEIRFFWAAHIVHHSSENFNLGTGIRNGWFTILYKPLFYMWIVAIGFHPVMLVTCMAIESLWQFQLHTKHVPRIKFLEKFMNMHSHHHVHHSSNLQYLDKNHGGYLIIFDRLFGTHQEWTPDKFDTNYGVLHPPESHHPWEILSHEYRHIWQDVRKAKNFKDAFMYAFGPPGWSPDGSTKTVKQLQKEQRLIPQGVPTSKLKRMPSESAVMAE